VRPRKSLRKIRRLRDVLMPVTDLSQSYVYNLKNQLDDDEKGLADKLDKKKLQDTIDETLD